MFGLFKKNNNDRLLADMSQRLFMLETAIDDTRKMVRTLYKAVDEAERVQARMAKTIADHAEQIRALKERVAEHGAALETQGEFNEFVTATGMDGSDEMLEHRAEITKHRGQLAGLWKGQEKINNVLTILKGRT